jgi:hypothetical protein
MALQPFVGPWPLFSFLFIYTIGRTPRTGDQLVARPLPINRTTQTQNKRTQTTMPRVGFEPTTPVFKRVKEVYALDRETTVIRWQIFLHFFIDSHRWYYQSISSGCYCYLRSRDSDGLLLDVRGSILSIARFFSPAQSPYRLSCPPRLVSKGYRGRFPCE